MLSPVLLFSSLACCNQLQMEAIEIVMQGSVALVNRWNLFIFLSFILPSLPCVPLPFFDLRVHESTQRIKLTSYFSNCSF